MRLTLPSEGLLRYTSNSQRARVATEAWAESNLYCPNCDSDCLSAAPVNRPAVDYHCPKCESPFQLKAQARPFSTRIVDAAYAAMVRAIERNTTPNLFALHYEPHTWTVANLILIPAFAFPLSAVEKRRPLGPTARRAGWVGCNILLQAIPPDARIGLVRNGVAVARNDVRAQYGRMRPLKSLPTEQRGWTLDVLNVVRGLQAVEFSLSDVYCAEAHLSRLHPANQHVRDKIRQQLQVAS